jgi:hypothetical protein
MSQEYNHQMLAVVLMNDISLMPDFDLKLFQQQADSLKNSVTSSNSLPVVDTVAKSFDAFMRTSLKFDEVFLADTVDTGEWFFGSLQPCYNKFRKDMDALNGAIHDELRANSADFDAGFYRSIIPGVVSVGAGLLLVMLLMFFIMSYYVNPICRMSDGVDNYRAMGKRHTYTYLKSNTSLDMIVEESPVKIKNNNGVRIAYRRGSDGREFIYAVVIEANCGNGIAIETEHFITIYIDATLWTLCFKSANFNHHINPFFEFKAVTTFKSHCENRFNFFFSFDFHFVHSLYYNINFTIASIICDFGIYLLKFTICKVYCKIAVVGKTI